MPESQPAPTDTEPTPQVPLPGASTAPLPGNPDAFVVELQERPVLPENIAAQISFIPPEGGGGGLGSIFNCLGEAVTEPFSIHVPVVGIGGTVTFCYRGVTAGPAVERVYGPSNKLLRELEFDVEPDPVWGDTLANDFIPRPDDPTGMYRVEVETAGSSFEAHFEVRPFQGLGDAGIGVARLIKPIGRSPSASPTVGETEYLLAVGFAPEEALELFFYETCRFTGKRRADQLGYTYLTGAQARVNRDGYSFFTLPATLRERVPSEQTYTTFVRGDAGVTTELSDDIQLWDANGLAVDYADPAWLRPRSANPFNGGVNPSNIQMGLFLGQQHKPCPSASETTPHTGAPPVVLQSRFDLGLLTPYDSLELMAVEGRLYANTAGFGDTKAFGWNLDDGSAIGAVLPEEQHLRRLNTLADPNTLQSVAELSFLADGARYVAGPEGTLARVDPATGVTRELLKAPVGWNTWRVNINLQARPTLYPALTVADEIAYFGGQDGALHAVDTLDGSTFWRTELPSLVSAPPAASRQTVYAGTYGGTLYALDIATGTVRWSFAAGDWLNTPVVAGDTVYITAENNMLFALDAQTGAERWRVLPESMIYSDPLPVGELVYIAVGHEVEIGRRAEVSIVAVGTPEQLVARETLPQPTVAPEAPTSGATVDGRRFRTIGTSDGFVAVRAEPTTESDEVSRLSAGTEVVCERFVVGQALDGATGWAYCPVAGGYIFGPLLQPVAVSITPPAAMTAGVCRDPQGDVALAYVDLVGAEVVTAGETLAAVFNLAGLPSTLAYNKPGVKRKAREYMWEVDIFLDGILTDATGERRRPDYSLTAAKWRGDGELKEEPLERFVQVDRWEPSDSNGMQLSGRAELQLDYAAGTLTLTGEIPGLTPTTTVVLSTFANTGAEQISDELICS